MGLTCKCGSQSFEPLGIQEVSLKKGEGEYHRLLFLVNCQSCGTTLSCSSLDYALLEGNRVWNSIDLEFFALEEQTN